MLWSNYSSSHSVENRYCKIEHVTTVVKDRKGKVADQKTEEKIKCSDDVMNFLKDAKIAESCNYFYWQMPLGQTTIKNKGIACKRIDGGGYEIIEGYNGIF